MKQVIVITCTKSKNPEEFKQRPIYNSLEKLHKLHPASEFDVRLVSNNSEGLSKNYNNFINDPFYHNKILLFVHDDVELNDLFLVEKLNNSPYTVTGLAGSKTCDLSCEKMAWHLATTRDNMVGEVSHKKQDQIWTTVFGPSKSRALIIDGLFIAVNMEKFIKTQTKFNENFNFHHYDIAFCLECYKNKIDIGVIPLYVVHHGLGDSMMTQEWELSNSMFKQQYKNSL
jgi:hypothetical protein